MTCVREKEASLRQNALFLSGLGLAVAALFVFPAFVISGVGHGWTSPVVAALWAVPVLPLLGVSWSYRHQPLGHGLAIAVVAAAAVLDLVVVLRSFGEVRKFQAVLHEAPAWAGAWAAAWALWQAVAVMHLLAFKPIHDGRAGASR
jgi:hypothetical protein